MPSETIAPHNQEEGKVKEQNNHSKRKSHQEYRLMGPTNKQTQKTKNSLFTQDYIHD